MKREELIYQFRHLRTRFQRQARFIREGIPFALKPVSSILLTILLRNPDYSASDLCRQLGISKFRVSRLLRDLEDKGYITREKHQLDQRFNDISLTTRGEELLASTALLNSTVSEGLLQALKPNESERFIEYMKRTATGLGARVQKLQNREHPLWLQQRRLIESTGTVTDNYLNTGFPIVRVHILLDIEKFGEISFKNLNKGIPYGATQISRHVKKLEEEGFVRKTVRPEDNRSIAIRFTKKGREHYVKVVEKNLDPRHVEALKDFSLKELREFCGMLKRIDQADMRKFAERLNIVQHCDSETLRGEARTYLVEELVRLQRHAELDEQLVPKESFTTIYRYQGKVSAFLEIREVRAGWKIQHLLLDSALGEKERAVFLSQSIRKFFAKSGVDLLRLAESLSEEFEGTDVRCVEGRKGEKLASI